MSTHMEQAKEMLFGDNGLRASNFKMFPGHSRETTSDNVASEVVKMVQLLQAGDFEVIAEAGE